MFVDGGIVAFALSLAHWPDIGGTWPGSYLAQANDTFQEAIRIPPVPIVTEAGIDRRSCGCSWPMCGIRCFGEGDLLGQIAATTAASGASSSFAGGMASRRSWGDSRLHDLSEVEMRAALAGLPDGVDQGEDFLDDGGPEGGPARIHVGLRLRGMRRLRPHGKLRPGGEFLQLTPFIARSAYLCRAPA